MTTPLRLSVIELAREHRTKVTEFFIGKLIERYQCYDQEDGRRLLILDDFDATDETQVDCFYPHPGEANSKGPYAGTILYIPGNGNPIPIEAISDYGGTRLFMEFLKQLTTECNIEVHTPEPLEY